MRNFFRGPSMRERFARLMFGRYGADNIYYVLLSICFVLIILSLIFPPPVCYIISLVETAIFAYAIFRTLSRNIYKRQQENEKFLKFFNKPKEIIRLQKCKRRDRKTHVYKKCPSCRNNLRLPKEKGKHTVVCPCCKNRFDVKI